MWSIGLTKEHIVQSSSFVQEAINEKINNIKVGNITVLNLIEITTEFFQIESRSMEFPMIFIIDHPSFITIEHDAQGIFLWSREEKRMDN